MTQCAYFQHNFSNSILQPLKKIKASTNRIKSKPNSHITLGYLDFSRFHQILTCDDFYIKNDLPALSLGKLRHLAQIWVTQTLPNYIH